MLENQDNLQVEHLYYECRMAAMLLPFGVYKNAWINNLKFGEEVYTIDDPPIKIRILDKLILPIKSSYTNAISMLIYGRPIEVVFKAMFSNYKYDINLKEVILLTYERVIKNEAQFPG